MKKNKILTRDEYKEKCKKLTIAAIVSTAINLLMLLLIILSCVFGGKTPKQVNAESMTTSVVRHNALNIEDRTYLHDYYSIFDDYAENDHTTKYSMMTVDTEDNSVSLDYFMDFAQIFFTYVNNNQIDLNYEYTIDLASPFYLNSYYINQLQAYYYLGTNPYEDISSPNVGIFSIVFRNNNLQTGANLKITSLTLLIFFNRSGGTWQEYRILRNKGLQNNDDDTDYLLSSNELININYDFNPSSSNDFQNEEPSDYRDIVACNWWRTFYILAYFSDINNIAIAQGINPNAWFSSDLNSGFISNNVTADYCLFDNHLFSINGNFYDSFYVVSVQALSVSYKYSNSDTIYTFSDSSGNDYRYISYVYAHDSRDINGDLILFSINWFNRYNSSNQLIGKGIVCNSYSWVGDSLRYITFYSDIDNSYTNYTKGLPVGGDYDIKTILTFNNSLGNTTLINGGVNGEIGNVFTLVGSAFTALLPILGAQLLPGITIGVLLFIPLVAILVFAIIKIIKK